MKIKREKRVVNKKVEVINKPKRPAIKVADDYE